MSLKLQIFFGLVAVLLIGTGCDMHAPSAENPVAPGEEQTVEETAAGEAQAPQFFPQGG